MKVTRFFCCIFLKFIVSKRFIKWLTSRSGHSFEYDITNFLK